ncbi:MAG TPA: helix-turn-helix domain-containing protein [Burkholderiaceae bacterium]|nr:helix-turn-helix domain-containing protein [Burkholderiaceae bacterium]
MFEAIAAPDIVFARPYAQPRTSGPDLHAHLLLRLLDELDYGVLLITPEGQIQHANHLARHELATGNLIRNEGGQLVASKACRTSNGRFASGSEDRLPVESQARETSRLLGLAARAALGHRSMVELSNTSHALAMAFIPLGSPYESESQTVLVLFGKRQLCEAVTMSFFARSCGLTPAEETVLRALCDGMDVDDIARSHGVAESTVRTQVRVLRAKTSSTSIRELIRKVSTLPPLVPAVRGAP